MEIILNPIGRIESRVDDKRDDDWGGVTAEIILDSAQFTEDALAGLKDFSHVEVIFQFHRAADADTHFAHRHPRGNTDWPKVGIFAQRGKDRPNHLGATICKIVAVQGFTVKVRGLDAFDGTPVLDLKPVMREFVPERNEIGQPDWATELMKKYF
jgi:tRNA-Thr(GGU) m(6)t(6)A37 methyltransferase TsaA